MQEFNNLTNGQINPPLQIHGVHASGDGFVALNNNGAGQNGGGGCTITGQIVGFAGYFADQLGAHILERLGQLDAFGHRDTVFGDLGGAKRFFNHHVTTLGAQGDRHSIREFDHTLDHFITRIAAKANQFCSHSLDFLYVLKRLSGFFLRRGTGENTQNIGFFHNQVLLTVDFDIGP